MRVIDDPKRQVRFGQFYYMDRSLLRAGIYRCNSDNPESARIHLLRSPRSLFEPDRGFGRSIDRGGRCDAGRHRILRAFLWRLYGAMRGFSHQAHQRGGCFGPFSDLASYRGLMIYLWDSYDCALSIHNDGADSEFEASGAPLRMQGRHNRSWTNTSGTAALCFNLPSPRRRCS